MDRSKPHINKRAIGSLVSSLQVSFLCLELATFCFLTILSTSTPVLLVSFLRPIHFFRTFLTLAHEAPISTSTMVTTTTTTTTPSQQQQGAATATTRLEYSHRNTQEHLVTTKHFITHYTFSMPFNGRFCAFLPSLLTCNLCTQDYIPFCYLTQRCLSRLHCFLGWSCYCSDYRYGIPDCRQGLHGSLPTGCCQYVLSLFCVADFLVFRRKGVYIGQFRTCRTAHGPFY